MPTDTRVALSSSLSDRYLIDREIGRGGMATVYLARDIKHDRQVALKVLDPELGAVLGGERFLAEIKVTANLQHPNLLPLFDSGAANGLLFYVMPFVEGESLRAKLEREKQLPVDEAVRIAVAVANALDYAHSHGVIHRDLKPENILLQAGQPVIADFGIALAVSNAGGSRITQTGLSLGTPQYMSPEQATGDRTVDGRTDIYSLAAVLYEMLSGEPPHIGNTAQAIVARVLTEKPRRLRTNRPNVSVQVDAAVARALEKLPADRFSSAREFSEALTRQGTDEMPQAVQSTTAEREAAPRPRSPAMAQLMRSPLVTAAGFVLAAVLGAGWWAASHRAVAAGEIRFSFSVAPSQPLGVVLGRTPALSPDGRTLVYSTADSAGRQRLFVRPLDDLRVRPIAGTEEAQQPFFSPDGRWIGFTDGRQLKKVAIDGGTATALTDLPSGMQGASWGPEGIVLSTAGRLALVPDGGGAPRVLVAKDTVFGFWPVVVSGGGVIYSDKLGPTARLKAIKSAAGEPAALDVPGSFPIGVVNGRLLYSRSDAAIEAIPFDERTLRTTGSPSVVVNEVQQNTATGEAKAAVSQAGTLAYVSGSGAMQMVVADERGTARPIVNTPARFNNMRMSPDAKRIAVEIVSSGRTDVWVFEVASGASQRLTSEGTTNNRPEWTQDGKRIVFRSNRHGANASLWWQPADGSGPATEIASAPGKEIWEGSVSPNGKHVLFRTGTVGTADVWYRALSGDTVAKPFVNTAFTEFGPRFSPDGRWVAFNSDETGVQQVYVRPFPGPGAPVPVSIGAGTTPVWSPDGRRIYYASGQRLIAATVSTNPTFTVTARVPLFEGPYVFNPGHATFDVPPDGKSFLLLRPVAGGEEQIAVVHNWMSGLGARSNAAPR